MAQKKYISLSKLSTFLDNLKTTFASLTHEHTTADITDYAIDTELSSTSANPVANSTINDEFEAVATAMSALESAIDDKADTTHTHDISEVNNLQSTIDTIDDTLAQKSQVQMVTEDSSEILPTLKIHKLTQEEYDQALANGTIEDNVLYLTPNEEFDLSEYATLEQLNAKADLNHSHDDVYYTESEVDALLANKSDASHNHDNAYDIKGSANTALENAKAYADTKFSDMVGTNSVSTQIANHDTSSVAHGDIRALITDLTTKLNNFLDVDDTTSDQLSEVLTLIENNKGTLESLTTSKVNVSDIVDNLTTKSTSKVLSANQGAVIKDLIDALQTEVDGKQSTITGAATSILYTDLVPSRILCTSTTGKVVASDADSKYLNNVNFSYLTELSSDVQTQLNNKADSSHIHDDRYYTETEVDELITNHTHDSLYDIKGSANTALENANTYTDNAVAQKSLVQFIIWEADD